MPIGYGSSGKSGPERLAQADEERHGQQPKSG